MQLPCSNEPIELIDENPIYVESIVIPIVDQHEVLFGEIIANLLKLGISLSLSDIYIIKMIILPVLLSQLNNDEKHLAAITLILNTLSFIFVIGSSPLFGLNIVINPLVRSIQRTELTSEEFIRNRQFIADFFRNALFYSIAITPLMMLSLRYSGSWLHAIFKQDEIVAFDAQDFLGGYIWHIPPAVFNICAMQLIASFQQHRPLYVATTNGVMGMVLASLLCFGYFGSSRANLSNLLWIYTADAFVTAAYLTYHINQDATIGRLKLFQHLFSSLKGNLPKFNAMIYAGRAITLTVLTEMIFDLVMSSLAGIAGLPSQEAFSIITEYMVTNLIFAVNFPLASLIITGSQRAPGTEHLVYPTAVYGLGTAIIPSVLIPLFFAAAPQYLMRIFRNNDPIIGGIVQHLAPLESFYSIGNAVRFSLLFISRGLGELTNSSIYNLLGLAFGVILGTVLALCTSLKVYGVGIGSCVGVLGACALLWRGYYHAIVSHRAAFYRVCPSLLTPINDWMTSNRNHFFPREVNVPGLILPAPQQMYQRNGLAPLESS